MLRLVISHCAPVLAGLKTGNLFNYKADRIKAENECNAVRSTLSKYGISIEILKASHSNSLIYIYRGKSLERDVKAPLACKILINLGYYNLDSKAIIKRLKERIYACDCFPHEIGLFLGYPPEDVKGFIDNKGCDFKICGYWKVYCNEEEALKSFAKYRRCTEEYVKLFNKGRAFEDMIVAV